MTVSKTRIESIDLLRGLVILLMALDHSRTFLYHGNFHGKPLDLESTHTLLFLTRWITHFCAPIFVFLAGISAFLWGSRRSQSERFIFLFSRGIWLILIELAIVGPAWTFDFSYHFPVFQVIWAIGISMVILSLAQFVPASALVIVGFLMIFVQEFIPLNHLDGSSPLAIFSYLFFQQKLLLLSENFGVLFYYPAFPWIGLMFMGYGFGQFYHRDYSKTKRRRILFILGVSSIVLFLAFRSLNAFGEPSKWSLQTGILKSALSFINTSKYPPSFLFLLMTIGPALLFLGAFESYKGKLSGVLTTFGRVPFFFYVLHIYIFHLLAMLLLVLSGGSASEYILSPNYFVKHLNADFGYGLGVVYLCWVGVVLLLFPLCRFFERYKAKHKNKWWLSYL